MNGNEAGGKQPMAVLFNIPEIDIAKGLAMTGGRPEFYLQILKQYCKDAENRLPFIEKTDDLHLFATHMHALKGASASIGAGGMSARAAEMEKAGKEGNIALINEKQAAFYTELTRLIGDIRAALESQEKESADNSFLRLITDLKKALEAENIASIEKFLNELEKENIRKNLESSTIDSLDKISDDVLMSEYESAGITVQEIIDSFIKKGN